MTDKKKQEEHTGQPDPKKEKTENTGDQHNAGKQVNQERSENKKDEEIKNEVTGANLDGQTI